MHQNPPKRDYHKLLNVVVPMIEAFCSTNSSEERSGVASKLNPDALGTLRTFADRMAVLAYRRQSPVLIQQGLTALAILGEVDDVRDLTFYLATLHYSALKLGMDARKVFNEAASLSPSALLQDQMRDFPLRPPDLSAFRLREITTDEGSTSFKTLGIVRGFRGGNSGGGDSANTAPKTFRSLPVSGSPGSVLESAGGQFLASAEDTVASQSRAPTTTASRAMLAIRISFVTSSGLITLFSCKMSLKTGPDSHAR